MNNIQIEAGDVVLFLLSCITALMGYIIKQHDDKLKDNENKLDKVIQTQNESKEEIIKAVYDTRIYAANTFCKKDECPVTIKEK